MERRLPLLALWASEWRSRPRPVGVLPALQTVARHFLPPAFIPLSLFCFGFLLFLSFF